jgi:GDP-4-dehydro-6-deoxy-D-mannose reductase
VTGAAGFAGSHLVDLLTADGLDVVGWHRPEGTPPLRSGAARWQAVDLLDRSAVAAAIAALRPAVVYHCAGAAHIGRSWNDTEATLAINVRGSHNLIEALHEHEIAAKVLIPSSGTVYADSADPLTEDHPVAASSPYAVSKLAQELLAAGNAGRPDVFIARAFNHIGPRQHPSFAASGFARRIAEAEAGRSTTDLRVGNLDVKRDLTDVRDMVRAYRLIVETGTPGRIYNVCSGRPVAIREVLTRLLSTARVPINISIDRALYRPTDPPQIVGDPTRILQELGWSADIPLERTLNDLLEYWRTSSG